MSSPREISESDMVRDFGIASGKSRCSRLKGTINNRLCKTGKQMAIEQKDKNEELAGKRELA